MKIKDVLSHHGSILIGYHFYKQIIQFIYSLIFIYFFKDYTDYVVIDYSKRDFDDDTSTDLDVKTISPNLETNPEFVYLEGIQERHYWGKIRSLMRDLGYKGYLEDLRHGRGKGIFIRNDVANLVKPYGGTVYRSKRPNPSQTS